MSYSQNDYYYNNKNDALSCNSRPISSSTYKQSSNNYESHSEMLDIYGNASLNIDSLNVTLDDAHTAMYATPITSTAVAPTTHAFQPYSAMGSQYSYGSSSAGVTANEHIMQPYDANNAEDATLYESAYGSGMGLSRSVHSVGDYDGWENTSTTACNGSGRFTSLGTTKMLPKLPIKCSNNMLDGMYNNSNSQSQRYGASLPSTPPVVGHTKYRMLPQTSGGGRGSMVDEGGYAFQQNNHFNGHGYVAGGDVSASQRLPTAPLRVLPQPQSQSRSLLKRQCFEDATSEAMYTKSSYDNMTISKCNSYVAGMYSSPTPTYTNTSFDAFYPIQRPHTSMAPTDYGEDYGYGCSSDNLSTYSDTPAISTTQQKLQQQRKHSIMMAMTTASVIASGETRIAPQQQKKILASTANSASCNKDARSFLFDYDGSGVPAKSYDLYQPTPVTDRDSHYSFNLQVNAKTTNATVIPSVTLSTPIAMLSSSMSTTSSPLPLLPTSSDATTMTTTATAVTTTRKLPKRLPTPKSKANLPSTTPATTADINDCYNRTSTSNKQLPKLPQPKTSSTREEEQFSTTTTAPILTSAYVSPSVSESSYQSLSTSLSAAYVAPSMSSITNREELEKNFNSVDGGKITASIASTITTTTSNQSSIMPKSDRDKLTSNNNEVTINNNYNINTTSSNNNNNNIEDYLEKSKTCLSYLPLTTTTNATKENVTSYDLSDYLQPSTLSTYCDQVYSGSISSFDLSAYAYPSATTATTKEAFMPYESISATTTIESNSKAVCKNESIYTSSDISEKYQFNGKTIISSSSPSLTTETPYVTTSTTFTSATATSTLSSSIYLGKPIGTDDFFTKLLTTTASEVPKTSAITSPSPPSTLAYKTSMHTTSAEDYGDYLSMSSIFPSYDTVTSISSEAVTTITTTTTSTGESSGTFTTTVTAVLSTTKSSTNSEDTSTDTSNTTAYSDFLKQFSSTKDLLPNDNQTATQLPTYITDFLNNDYKYMDYKIGDYALESDKTSTDATDNNYLDYTTKYTYTPIETTAATTTPTAADSAIATIQTVPTIPPIPTTSTSTTVSDIQKSEEQSLCLGTDYASLYATTEKMRDLSFELPASSLDTTATTTVSDTASSALFDDNFYDSYNVDLSYLTASLAPSPTSTSGTMTTATTAFNDQSRDYASTAPMTTSTTPATAAVTMLDYATSVSTSAVTVASGSGNGTQGGYYKPATSMTKNLKSQEASPAKSTSGVGAASIAAGKATSMLGGLSKGIKGGLDGVLSGVGAVTATADQKQQPAASKKGFGFGLASKLVPNVGGLLSGAAATVGAKQTTTAPSASKPLGTKTSLTATTNYDYVPSTYEFSSTTTTATVTPTNEYLGGTYHMQDDNFFKAGTNTNTTTYTSSGLQQEELFKTGLTMMYGDEPSIEASQQHQYGDYDEYGYSSEYDYEMNSNYNEPIGPQKAGIVVVTTAGGEIIATTTADLGMPYSEAPHTTSVHQKKPGSLLSSLASSALYAQTHESPAAVPATTAAPSSVGGGMFGSLLGKAAAAVQTATQAVNQGASIATAVVQKVPTAAHIGTSSQQQAPHITVTTMSAMPDNVYGVMMNHEYNDQLLFHQDSLGSQYSTTGDDYESSNMLVYTTSPITDKQFSNYYSNGSQSQSLQGKLLPAVPLVGSTGKKLPTINGKSGFLIKQQPTEIFDDEIEDELDVISDELVGKGNEPNYRIDSEQNDYYLDHHGTTPSLNRATITANGYYELPSDGYDYREDYFNEEDEYKYLEKEEEQKNQNELLKQKQLHQKHSSLDYIEEVHDDYIDDNYPSEDSGNYLDESSSGSVGIGADGLKSNNKLSGDMLSPTAAMMAGAPTSSAAAAARTSFTPVTAAQHQPIKKQDSIIMEEDEDELSSLKDPDNLSLNRKQSKIIMDDELTDLPIPQHIAPKKKVLMRGETEEVVGGHMPMLRKPEVTSKQRWHWAYNKIIMQLNVSTFPFLLKN